MLELTQQNFDQQIATGIHVIDFSTEWCPPCRMLKPRFDRAAQELAPLATFATMDAEQNPQVAARLRIATVPMIIVFKDGQVIHTIRALRDERSLIAELREVVERAG